MSLRSLIILRICYVNTMCVNKREVIVVLKKILIKIMIKIYIPVVLKLNKFSGDV